MAQAFLTAIGRPAEVGDAHVGPPETLIRIDDGHHRCIERERPGHRKSGSHLRALGPVKSGAGGYDFDNVTVVLILLIVTAVSATVYVLVKGVIGMAQGSSNLNAVRSQSLMQKRVAYQAIAVLFVMLLLVISGGSPD